MAPVVETKDGVFRIPEFFIGAIVRHASRRAFLTKAFFDAMGVNTVLLPAAFLLEAGSVLELGIWELRGLTPYLPGDLPSYSEAAHSLLKRAQSGPHAYSDPKDVPLHRRLLRAWSDHFAWDARDVLGAEFVIGNVDEDQFARVLAKFLLENQHELSKLLPES
jgi:hypothetical protein